MMTQNTMWERLIKLWHFYVCIYMFIFNTQTKEDVLPHMRIKLRPSPTFYTEGSPTQFAQHTLPGEGKCVLPVCPLHQSPDNTREGLPDKTSTLCSHSNTSCLIVNAQTRQTRRLMAIQANLGHHDGKGAEGKHYDPRSFETT